jgi:hypothetical protein
MPKASKPGGDKPAPGNTTSAKQQDAPKITIQQAQGSGSTSGSPGKGKQRGKSRKPAIGGTAVPGAKSTLPKEMPTSQNPNAQQQAETYNRDMRRRMQHMGTGPYSEPAPVPARKRAQKRIDERKKRQEEVKKTVVGPKPVKVKETKLGRRNTYFVLGTIAFVVLVIVIAVILHHV